MSKTIQDYAEEIVDEALIPYVTCQHHWDAEEDGMRVSTEYDIEDKGLQRIMEILREFELKTIRAHTARFLVNFGEEK